MIGQPRSAGKRLSAELFGGGRVMGSMSLMHWLIVAMILVVLLVPAARILRRAGFSGWWCILWVIPFVGLIGLWVFAFIPWPSIDGRDRRSETV
jgi:uncharacterized membrane protein YhaH (DUF805 family)